MNQFVRDMTFDAPTLKELAARAVKQTPMPFTEMEQILPATLLNFLKTASHCVNPKCKGKQLNTKHELSKLTVFELPCYDFRYEIVKQYKVKVK